MIGLPKDSRDDGVLFACLVFEGGRTSCVSMCDTYHKAHQTGRTQPKRSFKVRGNGWLIRMDNGEIRRIFVETSRRGESDGNPSIN